MVTDPISDLLTRIRNGYMARLKTVVSRHSNIKEALVRELVKLGYIEKVESDPKTHTLTISLRYEDGVPVLTGIKRVSKPGLRHYVKRVDLNKHHEVGQMILSTPRGLKTHEAAKREGVGGEVICIVW